MSGGAVSYPDDGATAEELLHAAEELSTYARRMGGGKIRVRGLRDLDFAAVSSATSADEAYNDQIDEAYRTLVVATTAIVRDQLSWSPHVAEIRVLVSPDMRGKGLGRALLSNLWKTGGRSCCVSAARC